MSAWLYGNHISSLFTLSLFEMDIVKTRVTTSILYSYASTSQPCTYILIGGKLYYWMKWRLPSSPVFKNIFVETLGSFSGRNKKSFWKSNIHQNSASSIVPVLPTVIVAFLPSSIISIYVNSVNERRKQNWCKTWAYYNICIIRISTPLIQKFSHYSDNNEVLVYSNKLSDMSLQVFLNFSPSKMSIWRSVIIL